MKIRLEDHGSIWLATPLDPEALKHLQDNVGPDAQWVGNSLVVEPQFVIPFAEQLSENGVELELP